ncbi:MULTISPECIES: hypothetical protein [unclassified Variovorax]|uniref:hypothetical protein n=1 Tax=unclassified Variovorax TaxID=663243 RepID=UPI00257597C9|nr:MULTISPECIES: hypothetical protein [unclassified Variovorax]MDM0089064.1 hypothetical protein [Variovorax sp. J22G40]MDM0147137.1 hypothetical protein [Variovorax sp. J2P1-31]
MPKLRSNEPPKPHAGLEKWTWLLIYGGLFLVILGVATARTDTVLGWSMATPGALAAVVGVALIYLRSRYKD